MLRLTKISLPFFFLTLSPAFAEPDRYHQLALAGIAQGHNMQSDKAEAIFNEMIALDPEHPLGYLAQALINLYRYRLEEKLKANEQKFKAYADKAIKLAKKNSSNRQKSVDAWFYLGITHVFKKAFAEAIVEFKNFFALKNIEEKWMEPWAHFYLGNCYQETGERQMAEAEYDIAYKYDNGALRHEIDKAREKYGGKIF